MKHKKYIMAFWLSLCGCLPCYALVPGEFLKICAIVSGKTSTSSNIKGTIENSNSEKPNFADSVLLYKDKQLTEAIKTNNWAVASKLCLALADKSLAKQNFSDAIKYNSYGLEFAVKGNDTALQFAHTYAMGAKYAAHDELAPAMENFMKALRFFPKLNDKKSESRTKRAIGELYEYIGDNDNAELYLLKARKEDIEINSLNSYILFDLAHVKIGQGKYIEARDYFQQYLLEAPEQPERLAEVYNGLCSASIIFNDTVKAALYAKLAYEKIDSVKRPDLYIYYANNLGTIESMKHNFEKALQIYTRVLNFSPKQNLTGHYRNLYNLISICYQHMGDYREALNYLQKYILLKDSINKRLSLERVQVSEAVYQVDKETEKKEQEIALLNKDNDVKKLQIANLVNKNRISMLSMANLNKEKMLTQLKVNSLQQSDSLYKLNLENFNKSNLVTSMKLRSLDQQNRLVQLDLGVQHRNELLLGIAIAISVFTFIIYYRRYRFKKLLEMEKIRSDIAADFHDELGSTLSSIALYSQIALTDNFTDIKRTQNILSLIGESSRGTVTAMQDMIWAIQPQNDNMRQVVFRMQEYGYPLAELKNIALSIEVDDDVQNLVLNTSMRKNIYLIFKESVNNAFKYALATRITISMTKNHHLLILKIADDGAGFDASLIKAGNGLRNMQKRAGQAGGEIFIDSYPGRGTVIIFSCPIV